MLETYSLFVKEYKTFFFISHRFWLARAVESYLRGNTSYCDQIFLMRRDLLQVSVIFMYVRNLTFCLLVDIIQEYCSHHKVISKELMDLVFNLTVMSCIH